MVQFTTGDERIYFMGSCSYDFRMKSFVQVISLFINIFTCFDWTFPEVSEIKESRMLLPSLTPFHYILYSIRI